MLDSRRLAVLCAVAEAGSFTAAAAKLHLTQSAISQQIALLEREVGVSLLQRVARGVRLTPAGELLARRSARVLRELASLEQELLRLAHPPEAVTLGVFSSAGAHLVPAVVSEYRKRFPDTRLLLHASQPEALASELGDGLIDVGLTWDYDAVPRPPGNLRHHRLLDDPLCLLVPTDHRLVSRPGPARLGDLADELWVVRMHGAPYLRAFETMCQTVGFEPMVAFRTEDYASVQGLVAAGIGISVAPRLSVMAQRPDVVLIPLADPTFIRRIDAVVHPDVESNALALQLLDLLTEIWAERR